jgi:RNA polymerase sigma-70 factor, ECF subfamily
MPIVVVGKRGGSIDLAGRKIIVQDVAHITSIKTGTSGSMHRAIAVAMAKAGDEDAFTGLFEYYKDPLGKRLYRLVRNQETAYDLYQEVFITVFKEFKKKTPIPDFQPWLYRVATNKAIDYLRRKKQLEFIPLPETKTDDPEDYALSCLLSEESHEERVCETECLKQALAEMSPQYRICVLLQEEWGYSQKEIAGILGITVKAVSSNVTRGRKQLQTAYLRTIEHMDAARKGGQN